VSRDYRVDTWKKSLSNPDADPVPLLSSTHSDQNPQYSPDGRYIAFHSTRTGASDIWVAGSDGTNARRLTFTNARTTATPRWSPDGEWIAFESNQTGQSEIYIVRSTGGPIRRLTDNPATDAIPSWSRDGRTLYFCSDRTGLYEIWKMPASGGQATQVTYSGGFAAVESPDARYLYYSQTRNYGPVWRIPLAGGIAEQVIPEIRGLFYAVTPRGIYFQSKRVISFWDAASGAVHEVLAPPKPMGIGLAVSPDGESLLFTQIDETQDADIYMIDGLR
jgi:Tol biopolymer transport system component